LLLKHLKSKRKITRKKFAEACGVHSVTISLWYEQEDFGDTIWNKIKPVLGEFNINPDYLRGTSNVMTTDEAQDPNMELVQFRKEILKTLKEIKDILKSMSL